LTYDGLGQHRRAIEAYGDAVRLSPDSAEAHYNLGVAYDKLRLYDEAVEAYGQGLVLNPDWAKARSNLGVAYTNKGLYDKAARQHRQAVRLAPDVAGMAYNLGVALDKKGSAEEAVRASCFSNRRQTRKGPRFICAGASSSILSSLRRRRCGRSFMSLKGGVRCCESKSSGQEAHLSCTEKRA
jgi:tetratricopeptide (TPR) repeat protein